MSEHCPDCQTPHLPNKCESCVELRAEVASLREKLRVSENANQVSLEVRDEYKSRLGKAKADLEKVRKPLCDALCVDKHGPDWHSDECRTLKDIS